MPSQFDLLLDEIHRADQVRQRGAPLAKAADTNWIADWVATRRERRVAAARDARHLDASFDSLSRRMDGMLKALPAPVVSSAMTIAEHFAKAFDHFTSMVAAGKLSPADACLAQAKFHHLADRLRAGGHL